jgi:hypothetical protein
MVVTSRAPQAHYREQAKDIVRGFVKQELVMIREYEKLPLKFL